MKIANFLQVPYVYANKSSQQFTIMNTGSKEINNQYLYDKCVKYYNILLEIQELYNNEGNMLKIYLIYRIIRISTSDNFWSMGETGPCGPCSEIFYDHGDHLDGGLPGTKNEDGDRFIEIWNLVFMQYEQISKDKRINLPKPSVDTGMGLERVAALLQGTHDNYETDHFQKLIRSTSDVLRSRVEPI